jgi:hypothetical protein
MNPSQRDLEALQRLVAFAEGDSMEMPAVLVETGQGVVTLGSSGLKKALAMTQIQIDMLRAEIRHMLRYCMDYRQLPDWCAGCWPYPHRDDRQPTRLYLTHPEPNPRQPDTSDTDVAQHQWHPTGPFDAQTQNRPLQPFVQTIRLVRTRYSPRRVFRTWHGAHNPCTFPRLQNNTGSPRWGMM